VRFRVAIANASHFQLPRAPLARFSVQRTENSLKMACQKGHLDSWQEGEFLHLEDVSTIPSEVFDS
jgi:hypothetical protein